MSGPPTPGPPQSGPPNAGPPQPGPPQPGPPHPGLQQPGWGGDQARYPPTRQPVPPRPAAQWARPSPAGPRRRRRRRLAVVLAIVGVLVVGGVLIGIAFTSSTKQQGHGSQSGAPTDSPSGAGSGSAEQTRTTIARNAETVVRGLGNGRPTEFCPLIDHADLSRLLREKHLGKCADIKLTTQTNHAAYQTFVVTDPSAIQINGDVADIPGTAVLPATFGTVEMREDGDGTWKFRFFTG